MKPINVTGEVWCEYMTKKVFPAIRRKMHWCSKVVVQIDNAKPHQKSSIKETLQQASENRRGQGGMEIVLEPQPA